MPQTPRQLLSPAQLEIMDIVWEHGPIGVAGVWKILGQRRDVARNTVQTTLTRLAEKGWLRYRAEGNTFLYSAAAPRSRVLANLVSKLVENAFGGSAAGLVMALLKDRRLSPDEARRIRRLIEEAEERK